VWDHGKGKKGGKKKKRGGSESLPDGSAEKSRVNLQCGIKSL